MKKMCTMLAVLILVGGSLQAQYLHKGNQSSHIIRNQRADLVITKIRVLPSRSSRSGHYHSRPVSIEVTIKNVGKALATSRFGIRTMLAVPLMHFLDTKQLPAGKSKKLVFKTSVPRSTQYLQLQSTVDYRNTVGESNEKNNYKKVRIKLPPLSRRK